MQYFIKAGIPAGNMYQTINELTGFLAEGEGGEPIFNGASVGNGAIVVTEDGQVIITTKDGSPVQATVENSIKLNGQDASYYGVNTNTIHEYIHSKQEQVHNFNSVDEKLWPIGRAKITAGFENGDTFSINGEQYEAYTGGDLTDELYQDRIMYFILDTENKVINFIGGGGKSKLILKDGDTIAGTIFLGPDRDASNEGYYINASGEGKFKRVKSEDIECNNIVVNNNCDTKGVLKNSNSCEFKNVALSGKLTQNGKEIISANGQVFAAVYNDYAEFFPRGEETEPGDIIALDLNSEEERYIKASSLDTPAGVHSGEFGMVLGGEECQEGEDFLQENLKKFIPVSLAGRVMVKVQGPIKKGQYVRTSDIPGVGIVDDTRDYAHRLGMALQTNLDEGIKLVKVRV